MNADCPVCGAEGAALEACQKVVPAAEAAEAEQEPEQQPEEQPEKEPEPPAQEPAPAVQNAEGAGMPVTYAAAGEVSTEQELIDALDGESISTIKLMDNVNIASTLTIDRNVTLDLNGMVLRMTGSDSVIEVKSGTLTLEDSNSSAEHKCKEDAGLWVLDESGDKTVRGGVITGGKATNGGGVCVQRTGTFIMTGGNIVGCHANNSGGGVYVQGTFQMNEGAKIIGCHISKEDISSNGDAVYINANGTMTMTGGEISNCFYGLYIAGYATLNANGGTVKSAVISTGTITNQLWRVQKGSE